MSTWSCSVAITTSSDRTESLHSTNPIESMFSMVRSKVERRALKFGREIRTPAMQAGLTTRRLTFRDIFLAPTIPLWLRIEVFLLTGARNPVSSAPVPLPAAA